MHDSGMASVAILAQVEPLARVRLASLRSHWPSSPRARVLCFLLGAAPLAPSSAPSPRSVQAHALTRLCSDLAAHALSPALQRSCVPPLLTRWRGRRRIREPGPASGHRPAASQVVLPGLAWSTTWREDVRFSVQYSGHVEIKLRPVPRHSNHLWHSGRTRSMRIGSSGRYLTTGR